MTNSLQLEYMVKALNIKNYKGYYSKNELVNLTPVKKECLLVNLENNDKAGTHHLALWKNGNDVRYFDSYGCPIPKEIEDYYKDFHISSRGLGGPATTWQGHPSHVAHSKVRNIGRKQVINNVY